jgi:hypothetical protein
MLLNWAFTAHWFVSFGGADRRLTEQGRNGRGRYSIKFHVLDDLFGERVV